jgi:amino acid adenylation domain-containing protein
MRSVEAPLGRQPIAVRAKNSPYTLTSGQQRIWFFEGLAPGVPLYNESTAVRLVGELNVAAMEQALNAIIARHEVLRTTIRLTEEQPIAIVHKYWPLRIKRIDLSGLAPVQRAAEVGRLLIDEPRRPHHLETAPGIRAALVRLNPREHVFILMMHHLFCDWASEGVLWRELSSAYRAVSRGEPIAAGRWPIQYGDYAAWQQRRAAEAGFTGDLGFWEEKLRGAPELLDLPSDRPRPSIQSYRGARQRFRLNATLTKALRNCRWREKISLFTVFAAALNTLLYRYTASEDILLGIPVADRERSELQSMIGFLLHTQVLRTELSGSMTFRELLAQMQKGLLELYNHREVPFDQVVRMLQPERSLSRAPLFQVMINWRDQDQDWSFIGLDGLAVESLLSDNRTSKFDLSLFVTDSSDEIWLEAEYNTDLFDDDRIARMFGHYQRLLEAVAADPDHRLAELPLLMESERRQLSEWNATGATYPSDMCIHQLFESQVERTPDAVAVVFGESKVTYRELNERSNQLAHHLRKLGVKADMPVGICAERSIEMIVGVLGILKAGGAYVPLDPGYPRERLAFMLRDSRVTLLVTQAKLRQSLPGDCHILCVDTDWPGIAEEESSDPDYDLSADNLAYVIYTSGSTGQPKGIEIANRSVVNLLCSMRKKPGLTVDDTLVALTTLSFDIAALELFLPLCVGAKLVIASREFASDGALLLKLLLDSGATVIQATPITFRLLIEAGWKGEPAMKVLCGGEALSRELADQILARRATLWNMYGPTETTIWSSTIQVEPGDGPVPIGQPIDNTQFQILDAAGQLAPIGVAGELHIGGVGLARGYFNRPELTAKKFIPDPFSGDPRARLYKTGDLARYLPDGNIEFLGRIDQQVKIGGFRIEPGEIEAALRQHPAVGQCVVVAREDQAGDKQLLAYVVAAAGQPAVSIGELRRFTATQLPDYMIPNAVIWLNCLPLTPNGKVDRKALPAPELGRASSEAGYIAPRTPIEKALAEIWCKVLGLKQVGVRDNFFDLGGHSFRAMRLIGEVDKSLNQKLFVAVFFQNPTIEGMAKVLQESGQTRSKSRSKPSRSSYIVPIRPEGSTPPLLLLHGVGGRILGFHELVRHLEPSQRVYGIEYVISDSESARLSLEALAAGYIQEIRNVQPKGSPYYLLGYSFGGLLAFEIAQQLIATGHTVGFLGMLDTALMNGVDVQAAPHSLIETTRRRVKALNSLARRVFQGPDRLHNIRDEASEKIGNLTARIRARIYARLSALGRPIPKVLEHPYAVNWFAASRYQPHFYPGCVTLFRAASGEGAVDEQYGHDLGWKPLAGGGVEVHEIPGTHHGIIREPNVQLLARKLTACLNLRYGRRSSEERFPLNGRASAGLESVPRLSLGIPI